MKGIGFPNRLLKEIDGLRDRWIVGGEKAYGEGKKCEGGEVSISTSTLSLSNCEVFVYPANVCIHACTHMHPHASGIVAHKSLGRP